MPGRPRGGRIPSSRSLLPTVVRDWWALSFPGVAVSKAKYRWAHQQERKTWAPIVDAGEAWCQQTEPTLPGSAPGTGCVMKTRWIAPGTPWQLAHDDTGTITLGPAHRRCNLRDAAVRGNKMRARRRRRLIL
jgi:hypothetical protein